MKNESGHKDGSHFLKTRPKKERVLFILRPRSGPVGGRPNIVPAAYILAIGKAAPSPVSLKLDASGTIFNQVV